MKNTCNEESQSCNTEESSCCKEESSCDCPIEMAVKMQEKAFCAAMQCAQTEIIKKKIIEQWGDKLEKKADAVVKAMGEIWGSKLTQAKAQVELRETIKSIYCEDSK